MKSHAQLWIDAITKAFRNNDTERLTDIANALIDAESAKSALRSKHYGEYGQSLAVMVQSVPENRL